MADPKPNPYTPPTPKGEKPAQAGIMGDPARLGGRITPIAEWAIRQAANLVNGVRRAPAPSTAAAPPAIAAERVQPPVPMPVINPRPAGGFRHDAQGREVTRQEPWFGPGTPPKPMAPERDVAGRAFDYRPNENMQGKPRQYSGVTFDQLRGMADSLDIVRLCIETRKDQIGALAWNVLPKQKPGERMRAKADARCIKLRAFFDRPDGRMPWDTWVRELIEELFVIDAPAIYVRRTLGGDVHSLEIVDGADIKPLLDVTGRTPQPPMDAYQHILKGMPAVNYTTEELIYAPRNRRAAHVYGLSVVEQIIMTVNVAIRREVVKLQYFTEGNVPEMLIGTPVDWSPDQIARYQAYWDNTLRDSAKRAGARFVPGGMTPQPTRADSMLQGPFDEWIARVVCFAFSLPPTAFVQQMNRATADTAQETALEEGLRPTMVWLKGVIDHIIQHVFGFDDLEMVYDDIEDMEAATQRQEDRQDQQQGILSVDEVRASRGLDPLGIPNFISGGPIGVMFLDDLAQLHKEGLTLAALRNAFQQAATPPPPPPQFDELGNPIPPAPSVGGAPAPVPALPAPAADAAGTPAGIPASDNRPGGSVRQSATDPLAGIPADILAAVGLGPQGTAGRKTSITRRDEIADDPEAAHTGHPQVLATLRAAESLHRKRNGS